MTRFIALSLCTLFLLATLAGCGQSTASGQTPEGSSNSVGDTQGTAQTEPASADIENTATLTPTVVCETDSYKLTSDSMETDSLGFVNFYFTFENKSADANWNCVFESVYYNGILSAAYESELDVVPGESVAMEISDAGYYGDVIGCNYIETIDIEVMIYDSWSNASPDSIHGVFSLNVDNTSTLPAMGDFVQGGSMEQAVIFENEYARITAMDFDPVFPSMLYSTTPCLILRYENISDIPINISIAEDFAVNGVPLGISGVAGRDVLPHKTAYYFWDDTFADVKMSEFDLDEIETFEFTINAEESSNASGHATGLIHEHVVVKVK